ncbi:hypothetical protein HCDG_08982 [Histoplasma capsulatum H143]|uniref:Uncharacterized protein n=1 Tax=Ajellomyces capsulatus (strain H143) TaxID=544712 RepID=C6HS01_AJECH|nr:hypothetical protein HCDG_08982 [Histoplasma capsulatum H143]
MITVSTPQPAVLGLLHSSPSLPLNPLSTSGSIRPRRQQAGVGPKQTGIGGKDTGHRTPDTG